MNIQTLPPEIATRAGLIQPSNPDVSVSDWAITRNEILGYPYNVDYTTDQLKAMYDVNGDGYFDIDLEWNAFRSKFPSNIIMPRQSDSWFETISSADWTTDDEIRHVYMLGAMKVSQYDQGSPNQNWFWAPYYVQFRNDMDKILKIHGPIIN